MLIVDSHCHLNFTDFAEDFDAVLARARENGVGVMQTICTRLSEFETIHALTQHEGVFCSVGVHPCNVGEAEVVMVDALVEAAAKPKVIGLGETGLDYYHDKGESKEKQQASFRNHIEASRRTGLPVIVHTRDAEEDTVAILREENASGAFPLLIHCFTGTAWLAQQVLPLGGYISLSGILTFKNAKEIQAVAKDLPLERILIETDAPYLAPMPHRGKRNEPAYTRFVCEHLAQLKCISAEEVAAQTTDNFFRLFSRAHVGEF